MNLSSELISQFVKITKDDKRVDNGSTVYGTIVMYNGTRCVKLDGSDQITPITITTDAVEGDRVAVLIKDHTATVTGNITSPSARKQSVDEIDESVKEHGDRLDEFENIVADTVTTDQLSAVQANIETLLADKAYIKDLEAVDAEVKRLNAEKASIETLEAEYATIAHLEAEYATIKHLEAEYATIENLNATNVKVNSIDGAFANFETTTTTRLTAIDADIKKLDAEKVNVDELDAKYANIDFANIDEAAIEKLFTDAGIIKDLIVREGHITGKLVGVTIKGDLIEAGTLKADKLVVKGSDGIYYKLNIEAGAVESAEVTKEELQNGLHGTTIIAKTITAEKINVDDLVAFDATIGGFNITNSAIYSGVKSSATNTTRGVYLDKDGQVAFGDSNNFLKYYKDAEGDYKLEISAASLVFSASGKNVEEVIDSAFDIEIGGRNLIRKSDATKWLSEWLPWSNTSVDLLDDGWVEVTSTSTSTGTSYGVSTPKISQIEKTGDYILSFDAYSTTATQLDYNYIMCDSGNMSFKKNITISDTPSRYTLPVNLTTTYQDCGIMIGTIDGSSFYVRDIKFEKGNKATDWTPAPEDMATNSDIDELNDEIQVVTKSLSDFKVEADQIYATVGSVTTKIKESADALSADIAEISKTVSSRMTDEAIVHEITTRINDGVTKVDTKTGFVFDSKGMTVDKSGAKTKTTISENGMTVYQKNGDDATEVLTANDEGVNAKNLHATTYLIVGGRSRFENFGTNRTGCFWIGGG